MELVFPFLFDLGKKRIFMCLKTKGLGKYFGLKLAKLMGIRRY
jgi:hypothetical protein